MLESTLKLVTGVTETVLGCQQVASFYHKLSVVSKDQQVLLVQDTTLKIGHFGTTY